MVGGNCCLIILLVVAMLGCRGLRVVWREEKEKCSKEHLRLTPQKASVSSSREARGEPKVLTERNADDDTHKRPSRDGRNKGEMFF